MSKNLEFKCTFDKNNPEIKTQHLFICRNCKFNPFETICESCAKLCHSSHDLVDLGFVKGYCRCGQGTKACYCFCQKPLEGMLDIPFDQNRQCIFLRYGPHYENVEAARCETCGMTGNSCACIPCITICHHGHSIYERCEMSAYCDCGDPNQPEHHQHCLISNLENTQPIPVCTSLLYKNDVKQLRYYCNTCDPLHEFPICSFCANICHKEHNVDEDVDSSFVCSCGTRKTPNKCLILSKIEPAA